MGQTKDISPVVAGRLVDQESEKTKGYIGSLDVLRIVAVVAVVWIHSMESGALGGAIIWCRFAVPAFTAVSVFLMMLSVRQKPLIRVFSWAPKRAWGIYRLFLIWNMIYLLARLAKHLFVSAGHAIPLGFSSLFVVGLVGHLWYLPFLGLVGVALALPARGFIKLKLLPAVAVTILLVLAGLFAAQLTTSIQVDKEHRPLTYFIFLALSTFPAALFVFPIGWLWNQRASSGSKFANGGTSLVLAVLCLCASLHSRQANLWHNLAGVLLLAAALSCSGARLGDRVRFLGELALPVYLLHPLLIDGLHAIGYRLHVGCLASFDMVVFVVTLCGSLLIAHFLLGNRWLAWAYQHGQSSAMQTCIRTTGCARFREALWLSSA